MSDGKIKITIVDDHPMIAEGLRATIQESEMLVIAQCFESGKLFSEYIQTDAAEFVIMDLGLPDINGLELCLAVKTMHPQSKVLFLTNHLERGFITQAIQNGANGYLLKNARPEQILQTIFRILAGELVFSEEVGHVLTNPKTELMDRPPRLTRREQEILEHIAKGNKTTTIASTLFISPLTVETHRRNLFQKLKAANMAELISNAMRIGLIQ